MKLKDIVREIKPSNMDSFMVKSEEFIELFKQDKVLLLDVRMDFETKVWNLPIALNIPANQVPDRLHELPKDKLIVVACPTVNRSITVSAYLKTEGYESKFLANGLLDLLPNLKGGQAKELLGL